MEYWKKLLKTRPFPWGEVLANVSMLCIYANNRSEVMCAPVSKQKSRVTSKRATCFSFFLIAAFTLIFLYMVPVWEVVYLIFLHFLHSERPFLHKPHSCISFKLEKPTGVSVANGPCAEHGRWVMWVVQSWPPGFLTRLYKGPCSCLSQSSTEIKQSAN